jgi:hypothetical protein
MKLFFRILKYTFLGLLGLIILIAAGLLFYYQSIYTPTPQSLPAIYAASPLSDKPILLPVPKKLLWKKGHFSLPANVGFTSPAEDAAAVTRILHLQLATKGNLNNAATDIVEAKLQAIYFQYV